VRSKAARWLLIGGGLGGRKIFLKLQALIRNSNSCQTFKLPSNNSLILIGVGGFVKHRSQLVDMQVWGIREIHIFYLLTRKVLKR